MTPERLERIRAALAKAAPTSSVQVARELSEYTDLLHEDLRITRQERDHAKHQALEHRKARARLEYDLLARDEKDTE